MALDILTQLRGHADYDMISTRFGSVQEAQTAVDLVQALLPLLHTVDADRTRRAAAIADIRARWP